jgi:hypothetical protein
MERAFLELHGALIPIEKRHQIGTCLYMSLKYITKNGSSNGMEGEEDVRKGGLLSCGVCFPLGLAQPLGVVDDAAEINCRNP